MGDVRDSTDIAIKQAEVERMNLETNIARGELRLMQLDEERAKVLDNNAATETAIAELDKRIAAMRKGAKNG